MSDREFERRVARALRAPVPTDARAKSAIMDRVRLAARENASRPALALPLGRTTRQSLIGVALAAGIGSITTLSALLPVGRNASAPGVVTSAVIGDSVVDRLRDTLRLVRLMFDRQPNKCHRNATHQINLYDVVIHTYGATPDSDTP